MIDAKRNRLIFVGILALDGQHRNPVDEKYYVFACAVVAVVNVEFLGDFIHVPPFVAGPREVAVVDNVEVKFPIFLGAVELALVAKIGEKLAVAGNVGTEALKLP